MLTIIFGAGASYDNDETAIVTGTQAQIPLTNHLLQPHLAYADVAKSKWPGAVALLVRLREVYAKNKQRFNLETALYDELMRKIPAVNDQLLSFKYYLHDIIRSAQNSVLAKNHGETNYTHLLNYLQVSGLDQKQGLTLVTFNYDTLLDIACAQVYPTWEYHDFDDYITSVPNVSLYKPHGSLSWRQNYNHSNMTTDTGVIKMLADGAKNNLKVDTKQIVKYSEEYGTIVQGSSGLFEPLMALPYKEKTTLLLPDSHKTKIQTDISKTTHLITIGWKGTEQHFHKEVLTKIPEKSRVKLLIVDNGSNDALSNLQTVLGDRLFAIDTFVQGFSAFVKDTTVLTKFLFS